MVIHNLYFSPSIISTLKSRMMECKLHAAHIGVMRIMTIMMAVKL